MSLHKLKAVTATIPLFLALTLGAGKATAISVLTFGEYANNSSFNTLGFNVTSVGASDIAGIDFNDFDVIYISQTLKDLAGSDLLAALGSRSDDLEDYLHNGGKLVFSDHTFNKNKDILDLDGNHEKHDQGAVDNTSLRETEIPAVPEPASIAFMAVGLSGLAWAVRKRKS